MTQRSKTVHLDQFPRIHGEANDRGRFKRAIEATPSGGELWVPPGRYVADSIVIRKPITFSCSPRAKIEAVEVNRDILIVEGKRENREYQLLMPVKRGDRKLSLTEEPINWQSGDMIVLTDHMVRFSDRQKGINTEVHEIASVEGNQVTLCDFVRLPKAVTINGGNVYRVFPLEDVRINQFTFQMKEGSTRGIGLLMEFVRGATVHRITGYRVAGAGIQVRKALHTQVQHFRFENPQVTGSGQGYGVQLFTGCLGAVIQDGYTYGCRHSVDLDSSFDVYVCRVTDYHSRGASFVMSHNGNTSDIVFEHCNAYHTFGSGFAADSQGFSNPNQCIFYNFTIRHCQVVMNNTSNACILFKSPCKDSSILYCQLSFHSGIGLNNAGVRAYPVRTELFIFRCQILGLKKGIALQTIGHPKLTNDHSCITIRDTTIKNCEIAFYCANNIHSRLRLSHLDLSQIRSSVFQFDGSTFQEFFLEELTLFRSPRCRFSMGDFKGKTTQGAIKRIITDRQNAYAPSRSRWALSMDDLFCYGNGNEIVLKGNHTRSGPQPLPNGWVEGQQLTLMIQAGKWLIDKGRNMILRDKTQKMIQLDENRQMVTFIWKNGYWFEL